MLLQAKILKCQSNLKVFLILIFLLFFSTKQKTLELLKKIHFEIQKNIQKGNSHLKISKKKIDFLI